METYFHNDPRIRKWINEIIERIFTVCILTGVDSDEEFQKGCQIVMKLTSLLQDIPTLPSEFLADGVKQLLEQQLPDARVINNFPAFQAIMDRMILEGISKVADIQKKEDYNSISPDLATLHISNLDIQDNKEETQTRAEAQALAEALEQAKKQARADALALAEALDRVERQAQADAQALAETLEQAENRAKADAQALAEALEQAEKQARADAQALAAALEQAENRAQADAQALAAALEQAERQAQVDAQALAETLEQAENRAKADAQALAEALEQAEKQAKADAQALAAALEQAENRAKADAQALEEALEQAERQAKADAQTLAAALEQAEKRAKADALALAEAHEQAEIHRSDAQALADALTKAEIQAKADALAIADALAQMDTKLEAIMKIERFELAKPNTTKDGTELEPIALIKVPALLTAINSKISQVFNTSLVPQQADILRKVLTDIFPRGTVYWNKNLMDQTFLAQVEDILICLHDPQHPCNLKKFYKEGWKVLVCSNEDLTFPRRLERLIRQIHRSGKMSSIVL